MAILASTTISPITLCVCESGLSAARCCAFDDNYRANPADQQRAAAIGEQARRALEAGRGDEMERLALQALELAPRLPELRALLARRRHDQGKLDTSMALYERALALDPNQILATQEYALLLFRLGHLERAEPFARTAIRLAPLDAQSHNLMGMILTELHRPQPGEYHYRRVIELLGGPNPIVLANLAWNLKNQGRVEEARAIYRQSIALKPDELQTLLGWGRMEEADRNFDLATELLERAERLAPENALVRLFRAVIEGRKKNYAGAIEMLDAVATGGGELGPSELIEKGQLLDRMGRFEDAFMAFEEGKRRLRVTTGIGYRDEAAADLVARLTGFFTAERQALLPRATVRGDVAQPLFIVGFPRSGTTMIEQTLTAHAQISAGDELPMIGELQSQIPQILGSPLAYPEGLTDLWFGDKREGLDTMRDLYLQRARQLGVVQPGKSWFTDKMPLNEMHLGLITLLFPQSPIIHVLRHPLDVVLSTFSNLLTHGFYCSYALETTARHYVRMADLVAHYRQSLALRYLPVRYEDIVDDQEAVVRRLLDFVGLPFDERCLNFHENRRYARTASYAQVTEKLYDRSRYRYRHYLRQLEPVIPMLEPVIQRLGYDIQEA